MDLKYYDDCSDYERYVKDIEIQQTKILAVQKFGNKQAFKAIEEMSELTKAILKYEGTGNKALTESYHDDIKEELADVQIMIDQLKILYGYDKQIELNKIEYLKRLVNDEYIQELEDRK